MTSVMNNLYLDKIKYSKISPWNKNTNIKNQPYDLSWKSMFDELFKDKKFVKIEETLKEEAENYNNIIVPYPELLFNAFCLTTLDNLKVVFIGQDPYFNLEDNIPQAMGLSFSIPDKIKTPSSLSNIYKNLKNNNHLLFDIKSGNLEFWALQGCLMLNSSLTVKIGDKNKNCHQKLWNWFTNKIISYISENTEQTIFVLWGNNAYEKHKLIDLDKHQIIISSHPSGLSADKKLKDYSSFNEQDHFGLINKYLKQWNKTEIIWQI